MKSSLATTMKTTNFSQPEGIAAQNMYLSNYIHKLEFVLLQVSKGRRRQKKQYVKKLEGIFRAIKLQKSEHLSEIEKDHQAKLFAEMISITQGLGEPGFRGRGNRHFNDNMMDRSGDGQKAEFSDDSNYSDESSDDFDLDLHEASTTKKKQTSFGKKKRRLGSSIVKMNECLKLHHKLFIKSDKKREPSKFEKLLTPWTEDVVSKSYSGEKKGSRKEQDEVQSVLIASKIKLPSQIKQQDDDEDKKEQSSEEDDDEDRSSSEVREKQKELMKEEAQKVIEAEFKPWESHEDPTMKLLEASWKQF